MSFSFNQQTKTSKTTKWTKVEDMLLQSLKENPVASWEEISQHFPTKTQHQLIERWDKVLNPNITKKVWTKEEDEIIVKFVEQYGTKNWTRLAVSLPGRVGKQCRERWRNHLDPNVKHSPWTDEEDQQLVDLHEKYGNQWVKIAEFMPGRTDNTVKNRWNSTLKKRIESLKTGIPLPKRGRPPLSTKVPKSADDIPKPPKFAEIVNETKTVETPAAPTPMIMSPFNQMSPFPYWSPSFERVAYDQFDYNENLFSPSILNPPQSDVKKNDHIFSLSKGDQS
ncbi:Myb-like DNA-binding domain containing protein [Tritrichomonas foetus]|uniref:Myb-like DNA-binding domain containing protein n=1 Tax=Tritrichomonas foetus TaxID=1144522 RepID=A0A1J4K722_9EUKA|nr:Myb-like DNA-binding domain containing protein [Tritrichomonas foetus]|eukprot:OHT06987.1 Myb-like DNA-binding domain containing protein [Tritrichomonas foetus]